jgi:hypothetical protein
LPAFFSESFDSATWSSGDAAAVAGKVEALKLTASAQRGLPQQQLCRPRKEDSNPLLLFQQLECHQPPVLELVWLLQQPFNV